MSASPAGSSWLGDEAEKLASQLVQLKKEPIAEGLLNGSLEQMYLARQAFKDDANHATTVLLSCFAGGGAMLFAGINLVDAHKTLGCVLIFLSGGAFVLISEISTLFQTKLRAGYNLYVASSIHSAMLFMAVGVELAHTWLIAVCALSNMKGKFRDSQVGPWQGTIMQHDEFSPDPSGRAAQSFQELIAVWSATPPNLYISYRSLLDRANWIGWALFLICVALASMLYAGCSFIV